MLGDEAQRRLMLALTDYSEIDGPTISLRRIAPHASGRGSTRLTFALGGLYRLSPGIYHAQQKAGYHQHFESLAGIVQDHVSMAVWILEETQAAREQAESDRDKRRYET